MTSPVHVGTYVLSRAACTCVPHPKIIELGGAQPLAFLTEPCATDCELLEVGTRSVSVLHCVAGTSCGPVSLRFTKESRVRMPHLSGPSCVFDAVLRVRGVCEPIIPSRALGGKHLTDDGEIETQRG